MPSIPAACKWIWRFAVTCAGVIATFPLALPYRKLGDPEPSASSHCMDNAACRYSIMATTAQISRQLAFLLTTTAWEDSRRLSKRRLEMNPPPPEICNTCDATATPTVHIRDSSCGRRRKKSPRPTPSRSVRPPLVGWTRVGACLRQAYATDPPSTGAPVSPDTSLRHCSYCTLDT